MRKLLTILGFLLCVMGVSAQELAPETLIKRSKRKNLTVKEWNTDQRTETRFLDRLTVYDEQGRKIEEIEYTIYGQRYRITREYNEAGFVAQEVEYDHRNKPYRIRKYEYNEDGTKKKQYNYLPNGKLFTVKIFEYIFND